MASAYGLKWSAQYKPNYLNHFWKKRLPSVLLPAIIKNLVLMLFDVVIGKAISLNQIVGIGNWTKVLIEHFLFFWCIYYLLPKYLKVDHLQDSIMCAVVLISSLLDYFRIFPWRLGWSVECLGFMYGIIFAGFGNRIANQMKSKWLRNTLILLFLSIGLGFLYLKMKTILFWGDYVIRAGLGIVITLFSLQILLRFIVGNRLNSFLGNHSYEIYLLHGGVFAALQTSKLIDSGVFILVGIIITLGLSHIVKQMTKILLNRQG